MRFVFITMFLMCFTFNAKTQPPSIYSFKIDSVAGTNKIDFDNFRGKKILIVNAASADSNFVQQYRELCELYQIYKDKLVIVVVPSNNFNTEQGTNAEVAAKYVQNRPYKFPVSVRLNITNPQIHHLYKWLTKKADNGVVDSEVKKPFYKYLIDKNGKLVSTFNQKLTPMHPIMRAAIEREY